MPLTDEKIIEIAEPLIIGAAGSMGWKQLRDEVEKAYKHEDGRWKGHLGLGKLIGALTDTGRFQLNGECIVSTDAITHSEPFVAKEASEDKRPKE